MVVPFFTCLGDRVDRVWLNLFQRYAYDVNQQRRASNYCLDQGVIIKDEQYIV